MTVKKVFLLCSLLAIFSSDVVHCRRRSRSRGRHSRRGQVQETDFQQMPSSPYYPTSQVLESDPLSGKLEFLGPTSPWSEVLDQQQIQQSSSKTGKQIFEGQLLEQRPVTDDCIISYESVTSRHRHPMVVRPDSKGFLYPTMEGKVRVLRITSGKTVLASCPGEKNELLLAPQMKVYITCRMGTLYFGRRVVLWSQLGCRRKPEPTVVRGRTTCGSSSSMTGKIYRVEWPIRRSVTFPQITFCFDQNQESVIYTHHLIHGRNIDAKIVEPARPSFKKKDMFSVSTNTLYSKREQKALFRNLLHSADHLTGKRQHYLARGHLTPDSDFILEPEQDATYLYANAVPQWQAINNGNWKSLENSVRELAKDKQRTLEIWTGIDGVLHLPDSRNNDVELFLGLSVSKKVIPVPSLLWKVVHDPESRTAVAIVEVNDVRGHGSDPHRRARGLYEAPCRDICPEVPWVDWNVLNYKSGRTFCCSVLDLRQTIPTVPDLGRVGILSS